MATERHNPPIMSGKCFRIFSGPRRRSRRSIMIAARTRARTGNTQTEDVTIPVR